MFLLITELSSNFGIILIIILLLSNQKIFKQMILKEDMDWKGKIFLSIIFGGLGILATYSGVDILGAIANTREISIILGGLLGGPFVGTAGGLIAGIHRYMIDPNGVTSLPCGITTIIGGVFSGYLYTKTEFRERWKSGILAGLIIVSLNMLLVLLMTKPFELAIQIVKTILIPMELINTVGIVAILLLTENIFRDKDESAAKQAEIALDIADKTLPYFLNPSKESYMEICRIIAKYAEADDVLISNRVKVVSSSRNLSELENETVRDIIRNVEALHSNDVIQINDLTQKYNKFKYKSLAASPIHENNKIIGFLLIFFSRNEKLAYKEEVLFQRLSRLISTQFELVRIQQLKKEASRSEIKALQNQINPHFLFNALNTLISFVRVKPDEARELVVNLSDFLRYNIENSMKLININEEIKHVQSYVNIEQARFGDRISVVYDIDEALECNIPALSIQPLVENSIKHGMNVNLQAEINRRIEIKISIQKKDFDTVEVVVEDDGIGISSTVIDNLYLDKMSEKNIGLSNVHNRLKLIYGEGLDILRLKKGTRISFNLREGSVDEYILSGVKYELFNH
ncbi:MAG: LytS/YhcK type 5TM receptor domain-containing protein [Eubacteriales bacterium]|nr:LytS/YhcK type 5TM receptor domain-containing protein [Eubacteriales bacterium]